MRIAKAAALSRCAHAPAIDRIGRGDRERDAIVITEIPYQVNKARLIEKIAELVHEKKLEGISELRDESNREGMRIVDRAETRRDSAGRPQQALQADADAVVVRHHQHRDRRRPAEGSESQADARGFVEFRREVVRRRTEFDLRKAQARAHILEGLNKAIDALDYIIPLIRNSRSVDEAKQWLTGKLRDAGRGQELARRCRPTSRSRTFLKELQKGHRRPRVLRHSGAGDPRSAASPAVGSRASEDHSTSTKRSSSTSPSSKIFLHNESVLRQVIVDELEEVKKEFGDARRTEIIDAGVEFTIEDLIADEDVAITVTKAGYIKRTPVSTYSRQGRGGKGRFGATAKNEDFVEHLFIASTHAYLMIFTDDGQVFKIKVHEIPEAAAGGPRKSGRESRSAFVRAKARRRDAGARFQRRGLSDDGHEAGRDQENRRWPIFRTSAPTASTPSISTKATSCST